MLKFLQLASGGARDRAEVYLTSKGTMYLHQESCGKIECVAKGVRWTFGTLSTNIPVLQHLGLDAILKFQSIFYFEIVLD